MQCIQLRVLIYIMSILAALVLHPFRPHPETLSFHSIVRILLLNQSASDKSNLNYLDFRANPPAVE